MNTLPVVLKTSQLTIVPKPMITNPYEIQKLDTNYIKGRTSLNVAS